MLLLLPCCLLLFFAVIVAVQMCQVDLGFAATLLYAVAHDVGNKSGFGN